MNFNSFTNKQISQISEHEFVTKCIPIISLKEILLIGNQTNKKTFKSAKCFGRRVRNHTAFVNAEPESQ